MASPLSWLDIEVEHVFAGAYSGVKRDRRGVGRVGVHEDDVGAALDGDGLQLGDQRGGWRQRSALNLLKSRSVVIHSHPDSIAIAAR